MNPGSAFYSNRHNESLPCRPIRGTHGGSSFTFMPKRKSTREHLLNTGAMIVGESGLRALTVRGLSLRAGTNTGSFVYHFGNREAFLTELLDGLPSWFWTPWQGNRRPSVSFQESIRAIPLCCWKPYGKPSRKDPCSWETP